MIWVLCSGSGGFGFQNSDYIAANALLKDLMQKDWPITLMLDGSSRPVVYYLAYYLPAALVGKAWGWAAANRFLLVWTVIGTFIAFAWFARISLIRMAARQWSVVGVVLIFCLAGGLDSIGYYVIRQKWPFEITTHVQWWASYFQYSSMTTLLYWVPQHAIAAWLVTGIVANAVIERSDLRTLGIALASSALWSPFGLLGTFLYLLLLGLIIFWTGRQRELYSRSFLITMICAVWVGTMHMLYITSSAFYFPHGFVWQYVSNRLYLMEALGAFWLLDFGLLGGVLLVMLAVGNRAMQSAPTPAGQSRWARLEAALLSEFKMPLGQLLLLLLSLVTLIVLPFYRMGRYDTIAMRVSIPALFILWTCVVRILMYASARTRIQQRLLYSLVVLMVGLGFLTSIPEIARSIVNYRRQPPELASVPSVTELDVADIVETKMERVGNGAALFFRYLGK
jgi:hypothetical protein